MNSQDKECNDAIYQQYGYTNTNIHPNGDGLMNHFTILQHRSKGHCLIKHEISNHETKDASCQVNAIDKENCFPRPFLPFIQHIFNSKGQSKEDCINEIISIC